MKAVNILLLISADVFTNLLLTVLGYFVINLTTGFIKTLETLRRLDKSDALHLENKVQVKADIIRLEKKIEILEEKLNNFINEQD